MLEDEICGKLPIFGGEKFGVLANAGWGGWEIAATLRRLHLTHRDVSLCKSRRLTPLSQANIAGMDIPDASASLQNSPQPLPGSSTLLAIQRECGHYYTPDN